MGTTLPESDTSARRDDWRALAVITAAQLIVILDTTVMFVALPSVQRSLGMSNTSRQWVVIAYTLAFGGLLLLGGRLSDRFGARRTLLCGATGFAMAAAVGGAAMNGWMLIGARAAQGACAALLIASNKSLLTTIYTEPRERAKAFGIFGATLAGGGVGGLIIGGVLTEFSSWRWCLYVNAPVVLLTLVGAIKLLPNVSGHPREHLDFFSAGLSGLGMASIVYAMSEASSAGWRSPKIALPFLLGALLTAAFFARQRKTASPLLPLRVLTERNRGGANVALVMNSLSTFGMLLLLTYELQAVKGESPLITAVSLAPFLVITVVTSAAVVPRLHDRLTPRCLVLAGLVCCGAGLFALVPLNPNSGYAPMILLAEAIEGIGTGLTGPVALNSALSGLESRDSGVASALSSVSGQMGSSIGTALFNTIAISATAGYIVSHGLTLASDVATVHGYTVAVTWGGAILLTGALVAALLMRTNPPRPSIDTVG